MDIAGKDCKSAAIARLLRSATWRSHWQTHYYKGVCPTPIPVPITLQSGTRVTRVKFLRGPIGVQSQFKSVSRDELRMRKSQRRTTRLTAEGATMIACPAGWNAFRPLSELHLTLFGVSQALIFFRS